MMSPRRRKVLQSIGEAYNNFNAKVRRGRKGGDEKNRVRIIKEPALKRAIS